MALAPGMEHMTQAWPIKALISWAAAQKWSCDTQAGPIRMILGHMTKAMGKDWLFPLWGLECGRMQGCIDCRHLVTTGEVTGCGGRGAGEAGDIRETRNEPAPQEDSWPQRMDQY